MVWPKPHLNQIPRAFFPPMFCISTRLFTLQMRKVPLPVPECTNSMTPTDLPLKSFVTDKRGVQIWAVGKKEYRPPSPAAIVVVQMQQTTKPHPLPPPACNVAFGATYWPKGGWNFFRGGLLHKTQDLSMSSRGENKTKAPYCRRCCCPLWKPHWPLQGAPRLCCVFFDMMPRKRPL